MAQKCETEACSCVDSAAFSYIWPGAKKRTSLCAEHMQQLASAADVLQIDVKPLGSQILAAHAVGGEVVWRVETPKVEPKADAKAEPRP